MMRSRTMKPTRKAGLFPCLLVMIALAAVMLLALGCGGSSPGTSPTPSASTSNSPSVANVWVVGETDNPKHGTVTGEVFVSRDGGDHWQHVAREQDERALTTAHDPCQRLSAMARSPPW